MCLWLVAALIQTGEVSLTKWAKYVPCRGQYAQSRQRRIRRWIGNSRINVHRLYKPIIQAALANWEDSCVYVSLDTTQFWDEYCLIRLAVVHRGRALPLAWRVLKHSSATVAFSEYQEMLTHSARYLPQGVNVILLADRGFVHTEAMSAVRRLGWHYRIRLKSNTWLWRSSGGWIQPNALHLANGEVRCFHNVKLHKQQWYGPVHVIFGRNTLNGELWVVVSDEPTTIQTFREYGLRFDIEELFKDEQSSGWNLQKSEIRSVCDLSRLCFILALATLYVTAQGVVVVEQGKRRWVDTHWFRGNSYFRIGLDWIQAALLDGWQLVTQVIFSSNTDPEPAMASRWQHEKRSLRLEFQVFTTHFKPD
ncbi:transposase family protein [Leptolyngbya sp. PCC 7375]|nr:transposase family protein [Leptolyngbya sp. PCC 7375]